MVSKLSKLFFLLLFGSESVHASELATVAIDIGHLPDSPGATSARGVGEYYFNKSFVELLATELKRSNKFKIVVMNSAGERRTIQERANEAAKIPADLLISIHHDSVLPKYLEFWKHDGKIRRYSDRFSGYSVFYSQKNKNSQQSLAVAISIGDSLRRSGFVPTSHHSEPVQGENRELIDAVRGVYEYDDLLLLKSASMPAVLVEAGVIVNRVEERKLLSVNYRKKLVNAIARGIERFLSRKDIQGTTE